jgi:hypothetical protein
MVKRKRTKRQTTIYIILQRKLIEDNVLFRVQIRNISLYCVINWLVHALFCFYGNSFMSRGIVKDQTKYIFLT